MPSTAATRSVTDFTTAASDFSRNDPIYGLANLFSGVDADALAAPNTLLAGTVEAVTKGTVLGSDTWGLLAPTNFSAGLSDALPLPSFDDGVKEGLDPPRTACALPCRAG